MEHITLVQSYVNDFAVKGNVLGAYDFGLNVQFTKIAEAISFPMDQVRYIILLLLMYPLGALHRYVPSAPLKHITGIIGGLWLSQLCFGTDWVHIFISSFVAFFIIRFISTPWAHWLVWVWMMAYMSGSHIYRMYTSYLSWDLDYTGPQMILTQKLTSLAFALYDGKHNKKPSAEQTCSSIKQSPSFLEFFGFVYFYPGFLAGPAFDIKEYLSYSDAKEQHSGRTFASLKTLCYSLLCFAVFLGIGIGLPEMSTDIYFTDKWMTLPFYERVGRMWIIAFKTRMRYYFAWLLAEGGCVIAGLGHQEQKGVHSWDLMRNADPIAFETSQNIRGCSISWNILTSRWLRRTIYERTPASINKIAVYAVSALWHGFYPGYYMFFLTVGIFDYIPTTARRKIRPLFVRTIPAPEGSGKRPTEEATALKPLYDIVTFLITTLTINYWVMSFLLLDYQKSLTFWASMNYYGHILPIPIMIILFLWPTKRAPRKKEE